MPNSRAFVQAGSQAGVFHVVSRVVDRTFRLGEREKDEMVRLMKALAAFHQVWKNNRCDPLQEKFPVYASMHLSRIF